MRFAFIMDPIQNILIDKDTTFTFMLESQSRGHAVHYLEMGDLFVRHAKALARTRRIELRREYRNHFTVHAEITRPLRDFAAVFLRAHPPLCRAYLHPTPV